MCGVCVRGGQAGAGGARLQSPLAVSAPAHHPPTRPPTPPPLPHARRARASKPEIRLTPGKGLADLAVPLEEIIASVVRDCRVVAFVKGTRTSPQCGFSYKVLSILQEVR